MKEAVRHHYIPQFILRSFCGDNGYLSYFDISQQRIVEKKTEEVFMARNLYRDTVNNPDDPVKIEKDLRMKHLILSKDFWWSQKKFNLHWRKMKN